VYRDREKDEEFVSLDCTTIPEALFETELYGSRKGSFTGAADTLGMISVTGKGTLCFDEVGEMSLASQAKLLRLLDGKYRPVGSRKEIDVGARIIATTNRNLQQMVAEGAFRKDLFFRLMRCRIFIPPLRERPEDFLPILEHCLDTCEANSGSSVRLEIREESLAFLKELPWPGNVREVETAVLRTLLQQRRKSVISTDDIAAVVTAEGQGSNGLCEVARSGADGAAVIGGTLLDIEKRAILMALTECRWNLSRAASRLGVPQNGLRAKMRKHCLSTEARETVIFPSRESFG
jgi:transcriptional regulator with PAS, ATPase and Fis domain